jgi:hypothetical protein
MVDVDVPADAPLRRPTARARRALLWAQLSLTCLVVLVAAAVGGVVQDRIDDRDARLPDPPTAQPATAPLTTGLIEARPVRGPIASSGHAIALGGSEGPLAALGTLLVGWTLTAAAGTVGRRRLEEREHDRWAADWAGVEPAWSGRVP